MNTTRKPAPSKRGRAVPPALPDLPLDLRTARVKVDGEEFVVLSFRVEAPGALPGLTLAEREVVAGMLAGRSNAEIARQRGTYARTVANQVASVLHKLGVSSRRELVAKLTAGGSARRVARST